MTDQEKMEKLFEAALRAPTEPDALKPKRAVVPQEAPAPVAAPEVVAAIADPAVPVVNAGLDEETAAELGALLDERQQRMERQRRRNKLVTVVVFLALTGGGYGWFIQSPQRVQAFHEAMNDIRSVGDFASIVAKYNKSLEKIKVHSAQIDSATASRGIDPTKDNSEDAYFEKETKEMMIGEGKTVGERNRVLREKFGAAGKNGGKLGISAPVPAAGAPPPPNP
jgi:hypothetical protein